MAYHILDNVYTHTFTPREYQVELLDSIKRNNTIVCSSTGEAKTFIAVKLVQEYSWCMRSHRGKRALFILDSENISIMTTQVRLLTDLTVTSVLSIDNLEWDDLLSKYSVIVLTADICIELILNGSLSLSNLVLLVIDDCLHGSRQQLVEKLMIKYDELDIDDRPRVLGLVAGLLSTELRPVLLEAEMQRLEKLLRSSVDTSSEVVTLLRLCCRPKEHVVECALMLPTPLCDKLRHIILNAKEFLAEHRYDPSEIYSDELLEEFLKVPDPKLQPLEFLNDTLKILEDLGPWAVDQAALNTISLIEKLKVKVPYERHYLLLCMIFTVMLEIRAYCDSEFGDLEEKEKIAKHSSPKVLRFLEVIKEFKPANYEKPPEPPTLSDTTPTDVPQLGKGTGRKNHRGPKRLMMHRQQSDDNLCALVFVHNRMTAKVLFMLLSTMSQQHPDYYWVSTLYSVDKITDPSREPREAELEHRRQEEVLKKYRAHECNIMIATSVLEQGCDLPKCNLVVRFDLPNTFHSYLQSKARARLPDAYYLLVVNENDSEEFVEKLGEYMEVEKTLLRRAYSLEPDAKEKAEANRYNGAILPYQPLPQVGSPNVTLATAIQLVNKYCAKLPSDTFTRLTPLWNIKKEGNLYVCTLRLPINSPVKQTVSSPPVVNCLLAKRIAALYTCKLLHQAGELDDMLQPVGKENFKASEDDWNHFPLEPSDEELVNENVEQRPGTTKRRQYYYKRVSNALLACHPIPNQPVYFYRIIMTLTCPLPEEQNTRGRKIYPPEESPQGFGILTCKPIPQICPFPIFTRSGEVSISLELCTSNESLDDDKIHKIREFLNYTFTSVLRLQRYLMLFEPEKADSSYLIAPTITVNNTTKIDWDFIDLIYDNRNILPQSISDEERVNYKFEPCKYKDAVVMPWYRNRDQPQYFYVAEICTNLNPKSAFPGSEYATFDEYYNRKYNIKIQNLQQHLLDVDHTSARLNFLTPRYVNRKGVALPTSSEETKRAKRENLEQKQILVPELCAVHPFPASLWRKAVCLPCILYRINALLLADQIRLTVAHEMNLGEKNLPQDFKWPTLNFGWSLLEVLKKKPQDNALQEKHSRHSSATREKITEIVEDESVEIIEEIQNGEEEEDEKDWNLEIGTWSNDMIDIQIANDAMVRYASPTSWLPETYDDFSDSDECYSEDESSSEFGGLHIEFMGDNIAEAVDTGVQHDDDSHLLRVTDSWENYNMVTDDSMTVLKEEFLEACNRNVETIFNSGIYIRKESNFKKANIANSEKSQIALDNNVLIKDLCPEYNSGTGDKIFNDKIQCLNMKLPFSFDLQPSLEDHPGPSPSVILQALTMSNANDGINLERLETIGDSFLKYAITDYLYSKYENVHEGKLSHLRSKQVSNLNLYRLGKRKNLGECMIATKFDPHDNWLPPCFYVPRELEEALLNSGVIHSNRPQEIIDTTFQIQKLGELIDLPGTIPYNLVTQHSIPDKSIADCVEALIGAYLIECGPHGALLFMAWLGIRVLPRLQDGSYGKLENPKSPLLRHVPDPEGELDILLDGYAKFEENIGYQFRDRAYLLQALTHASYSSNTLTDCYQRLEFLGDAVLDYLITRHLYEDSRMHSPGALTDLRSALVNNTIFASLAVRHGFHKYFRHLSPGLHQVVERFVRLQEESGHALAEELYLLAEHECEEVEDVEVPKALGDVFESIAGAIYLDSGRSLDAVWQVYYQMMKNEIEQFSDKVPKSPIRELLELEPETAKFGTPEKLVDGRRVRVTVEVFGKGIFKGIGRNYRIAKCTAAKCALKHLKKQNFTRRN
ncbi:endoribonuclease Dcr-1 [Onthophagus taurus]|uniref:endoribonuclease Dcr-1 n=1 Tax=Onthophagus taurus TaxID=166361 RepID=UPI000C204CFC|nr:endoribonuclease Dcr-1 [Onthophagus taurus]